MRITTAGALALMLTVVANVLCRGWVLMIGMGIIHGSITSSCPAIGFGASCGLALILGMILGAFRGPRS